MSSWTQKNNMNVGQMQYNPYGMRYPTYKADPIHGENAAWQFPMSGGEIYLPDADRDIIWWIKVDQNGTRTVTPFDVALHVEPKPVDMNEVLARLNNLEKRINAKSNKSDAKRPNDTAISATE